MTTTDTAPVAPDALTGDTLAHCYCLRCNTGTALCGYEHPNWAEARVVHDGPVCVVCEDLAWRPCPGCGA
jgi:hypothetical protein